MPVLKRPDGAEIYWEERGQGPLVVFAMQFFGISATFESLINDLEQDHRVVTYDLRGTGRSSREGPYNIATDAEDLGALIEELGPPAVVVGLADGTNRSVQLAAERPELIRRIVTPGGNPLGRRAAEGTDALAASESVVQALLGLLETDYRAGLRTMIDTANPQLDEEGLRDRVNRTVEHISHDVLVTRMNEWVRADELDEARALGDRLWIIEHGRNPWFPIEVARRTQELLPEARLVEVEDGPLTRPDLTSAFVREATNTAGFRLGAKTGSTEGSE
jgi:pimeloyl-ACP methyl ester carboxylesterase